MAFAPLLLLLAASDDSKTATRDALVAGNLAAAITAADAWSKASPDALPCYAALLEAAGRSKQAAAIRKGLPPAPPTSAVEPARHPLPATAYVSASSLTLRAQASPTGAVLGRIPIGAKVEVLSQQGPFTKIRASSVIRPLRVLELSPGAPGFKPAAAPAVTEGWASTDFLAKAAPTVAELTAQSDAADPATRELALERLAALTRDSASWAKLAGAAFDVGKCGIAANAAEQVKPAAPLGGYVVQKLELHYRCRGDLSKAVPLGALPDKKSVPPAACIDFDPQPECGFCELGYEKPNGPEAKRERARLDRESAALQKRLADTAALFPKGPMLRIRLKRVGEPERLALAETALLPPGCGEVRQAAVASGDALDVPPLALEEELELWISIGGYEAFEVGLVRQADLKPALDAFSTAVAAWNTAQRGDAPVFEPPGPTARGPEPRGCCCD